jgi:hypothetical protein
MMIVARKRMALYWRPAWIQRDRPGSSLYTGYISYHMICDWRSGRFQVGSRWARTARPDGRWGRICEGFSGICDSEQDSERILSPTLLGGRVAEGTALDANRRPHLYLLIQDGTIVQVFQKNDSDSDPDRDFEKAVWVPLQPHGRQHSRLLSSKSFHLCDLRDLWAGGLDDSLASLCGLCVLCGSEKKERPAMENTKSAEADWSRRGGQVRSGLPATLGPTAEGRTSNRKDRVSSRRTTRRGRVRVADEALRELDYRLRCRKPPCLIMKLNFTEGAAYCMP